MIASCTANTLQVTADEDSGMGVRFSGVKVAAGTRDGVGVTVGNSDEDTG